MAPLSWSYKSKITPYVLCSDTLLDMGTGGGEFLSSLPFPKNTFATERYPPNIPVAKKCLEPLGIMVTDFAEDSNLPFENDQFDLIINRHESYDLREVNRVLKRKGFFITQQVGDKDNIELNNLFNAPIPEDSEPWDLNFAIKQLHNNHFEIVEQYEEFPTTRIYDIGALIYYLTNIPWQIEDFSPERYKEKLQDLHEIIESKGFFDVISHRFFLISLLNK
jgi:SAM-dependent methyltransferase